MLQHLAGAQDLRAGAGLEGDEGRACAPVEQMGCRQDGAAIEQQHARAVIAAIADADHAVVALARIGAVAGTGVVGGRGYHAGKLRS